MKRNLKLFAWTSPLTLLALGACASSEASATVHEMPAVAERAPSAAQIIQRHVEETNTAEMIRTTESSHVLGTIELAAMGLKGDMEVHAAKPNKFLLRSTMGPAGTTLVGYDGTTGWMSNPMMGTSILEGVELLQLLMQAEYDAAAMNADDYESITFDGREQFEGRDCYKLTMIYKAPADKALAEESVKARTTVRWFDVEKGLCLGQKGTQSSPQGEIEVTTVFDEYADMGGFIYPVRSTQKMMGMEVTMTIDEAMVNTVDHSVFALPEDVKALMDE